MKHYSVNGFYNRRRMALRALAAGGALALGLPVRGQAGADGSNWPRAAAVPGGVARVDLGPAPERPRAWADDAPIRERSEYRLDLYARENALREIGAALHAALRGLGFRRLSQVQDDYLPDEGIYVKSVSYEYYDDMEG